MEENKNLFLIEPEWSKTLHLIEQQTKLIREDIPFDMTGSRDDIHDLEMFDLKLSAMQSRIKKALKELQYASLLSKDILTHIKEENKVYGK
jgi:hypothetical protein